MSARRDWTETEARAWLKASLPKGWGFVAYRTVLVDGTPARVMAAKEPFSGSTVAPTLRAACKALVRAAKRAGVNVNAAPEPQGGGK